MAAYCAGAFPNGSGRSSSWGIAYGSQRRRRWICTALEGALLERRVEPDEAPAQHIEHRLQRRALHVERQFAAAVEHTQIAEHLAFRRQHRGIQAVARLEHRDVVAHDTVQGGLRVTPDQREFAALRAVDERRAVGDGGVDSGRSADENHDRSRLPCRRC